MAGSINDGRSRMRSHADYEAALKAFERKKKKIQQCPTAFVADTEHGSAVGERDRQALRRYNIAQDEARKRRGGGQQGVAYQRSGAADQFALAQEAGLKEMIQELEAAGKTVTNVAIAEIFNARGRPMRNGQEWTDDQILKLRRRIAKLRQAGANMVADAKL